MSRNVSASTLESGKLRPGICKIQNIEEQSLVELGVMVGRASAGSRGGTQVIHGASVIHRHACPPHFRPASARHNSYHGFVAATARQTSIGSGLDEKLSTIISSPTLYAGTTEFSLSESPPDGVGKDAVLMVRINRNPSSVLNSIPLTSGDRSDLGHYCAEIITLGLRVVSVSGGREPKPNDSDCEGANMPSTLAGINLHNWWAWPPPS